MFFKKKKKIDEIIKMTTDDMVLIHERFDEIKTKQDALKFLDLLDEIKLKYNKLIKKSKNGYKKYYRVVNEFIETMVTRGLVAYDSVQFDQSIFSDHIVYIDAHSDKISKYE